MYGALLRNGLYLAFGALFAAVIRELLAPFVSYLQPYAQGTAYFEGLQAVEGNVLLIMILAVGVGVITRAVVESRLPGVQ